MTFRIVWLLTLLMKTSALKDLNIMGLLAMEAEAWPDSIGGDACLPAIEMALEHVNEREDILPGYNLQLIWKDTRCAIGPGLVSMFDLLNTQPAKLMVLGPVCSVVSEIVAQTTTSWNITHLSPGSASPLLSNRKLYPRFFRIMSSDARMNELRLALAAEFGWKKIATITPVQGYFSAITDDLVRKVQTTDIRIISQEIFDDHPAERVRNLKQKDARIILVVAYGPDARRIICAAYKEGLHGKKHVWIFQGWLGDGWWIIPNGEDSECTQDQLDEVAEGSLMTGFFSYNPNKYDRGIANLTVSEFYQRFTQLDKYNPKAVPFEYMSGNCYDAVWGIGLTLQCTDLFLKKTGYPNPLDQFDYSDTVMTDAITSCMKNLSFVGISGHMQFGYLGDPVKEQKLEQVQGGKAVIVGVYRADMGKPYIEWQNGGIYWKDSVVPRDSTLVTYKEAVISIHLYSIMSSLSGFGVLMAISFFMFSVIHRKHAHVKLSSPNINNILLVGCVLTYSYVFMIPLNGQSVTLCTLKTFALTTGFSMSFGALFSKTWRVYKIFSNKKLLPIRIKDFQLIGIVLVLVSGLICLLAIWYIIDQPFVVTRTLKSEVYSSGNDAEIHMYIRVCTSRYSSYLSWILYIMQGVILAFGAFLAFETRKVKIEALNDSRLIGTCVYNVVVLSAVAVTLNLVLEEKPALVYGMTSAILIIGTTSTQLIVFIPKFLAVYYPHEVTVQPHSITNTKQQSVGLTKHCSQTQDTALPTKAGSTSEDRQQISSDV